MICCCGILRLVASSYHVVPGGAKTSLHLQWPRTEGGRVTLKEVYQALVARGLADDPRGEDGISRVLAATKKEYEDLSQEDRWEFDEDRLSHPFNDTRILTGDLQSEVNRVLAGIDIDTGELLLADRMATQNRPVDLVLAHHPVGRAWAEMADVMDMQADVWGHQGVPLSFGDAVIPKRKTEVRRRAHPPVGRAWAEMADVMDMQADVWGHQGVPLSFGDAVIPKRKTEVRRRTHPANTERSV